MSFAQTKLEEILAEARRLPIEQQQRLVESLQADNDSQPSENRRQQAMKRKPRLDRLLRNPSALD